MALSGVEAFGSGPASPKPGISGGTPVSSQELSTSTKFPGLGGSFQTLRPHQRKQAFPLAVLKRQSPQPSAKVGTFPDLDRDVTVLCKPSPLHVLMLPITRGRRACRSLERSVELLALVEVLAPVDPTLPKTSPPKTTWAPLCILTSYDHLAIASLSSILFPYKVCQFFLSFPTKLLITRVLKPHSSSASLLVTCPQTLLCQAPHWRWYATAS